MPGRYCFVKLIIVKNSLSKKAIRLLEDNGYLFKIKDDTIIFRKSTEYTSIVVVSFLILIIASPLLLINTFLALLTLLLGITGLVVRFKYYTKKMNFIVKLKNQKFDFNDNVIELEDQSLSYASKILINSKFVSEYTSSFKSTSEEHEIAIRIQLLSGSILTLFKFHSDYEKPSEEIMEVHDFIKELIRWTKKKDAQSKAQTQVSDN
jgi:hypothetical protein